MSYIYIYNGPTKAFREIISKVDLDKGKKISLRDLVRIMDSKEVFLQWLEENLEVEPYILTAYGEEFSSIKEHFIDNLPEILSNLVLRNYIIECYFQNPPVSFKEGLKNIFQDEVKETDFEYKKINKLDLQNLYQELSQNIIGQDSALIEILSTIYRLVSLKNEKPVVMMFYGVAGVGKTETAKIIGNTLQGGLFRKQLSMYQTGDFSTYLFGGDIDKPSLAKDLLKRESNVILFDEFNRCPPYFHSAFFQMFDEGLYEDKNFIVNLKNSIIICTANYNSIEEIYSEIGGPLFSRFDQFVSFSPLSKEDKKLLITNKYYDTLERLNDEEKKYIEESRILEMLTDQAELFSNVRNIEKGVIGAISRNLTLKLIEEYNENR